MAWYLDNHRDSFTFYLPLISWMIKHTVLLIGYFFVLA